MSKNGAKSGIVWEKSGSGPRDWKVPKVGKSALFQLSSWRARVKQILISFDFQAVERLTFYIVAGFYYNPTSSPLTGGGA